MTPAVRRLLREHDLSPAQIVGHRRRRPDHPRRRPQGRRGRCGPAAPRPRRPPPRPRGNGAAAVRRGRTGRARPAPPAAPAGTPIEFPDGADEVLVPMTQMRKGIAAQMTRALPCRTPTSRWRSTRRARRARARRPSATTRPRGDLAELRPVRRQGRLPRRSSATRRSTPTGPSRACWRSGGSTSGVAVAVDDGPDRPGRPRRRPAVDQRAQRAIADVAEPGARRQAQARRLRRQHVHRRQHRLVSARTW